MTVSPVSLAGPLVQPTPASAGQTAPASQGGGSAFSNLVDRFIGGAAQSHQQAEAAVQDLALGRTDNLHGVLMKVAQADLSFRLILELRNRLSDAYQEVMKMTV